MLLIRPQYKMLLKYLLLNIESTVPQRCKDREILPKSTRILVKFYKSALLWFKIRGSGGSH